MLAEPCRSPGGSPVLERLDPLFQVAALPSLPELLDNARHVRCLLGCELTTSQSRNDLALNRREIVQALHVPDLQRDRPPLPCRSKPVKAQAQRRGVARKRQLDGLAGQGFGLAVQERLHGQRCLVPASRLSTAWIAALSLPERHYSSP